MTTLQPAGNPWQLRAAYVLGLIGFAIIMISFLIGLFQLTPTAIDYWGNNAKIHRDCVGVDASAEGALAESCDALGQSVPATLGDQLVVLTSTNRWKEPFTFLGVASFMVGIALAFSSIPGLLRNRGEVMAAAFKHIANAP